ncbi:MAG: DUF4160 domain-containing protein [Bauldia sp.]|nr:DUF4160 domain-containing protein [Bauldia sp.]
MGKLLQIGNASVRVYANDHLPPHFHIVTPDHEALIDLAGMDIVAGVVRGAGARAALVWARANRSTVVAEWNRVNPSFPIVD